MSDKAANARTRRCQVLDCRLVASVASGAAHHLLRLTFAPGDDPSLATYRPEGALYRRSARSSTCRCSSSAPPSTRSTGCAGARTCARSRIAAAPDPAHAGAHLPRTRRRGRRPARPREHRGVDRVGLRLDTANQARRIASRRAAWWMAGGRPGEWNLWYYSGCAMSVVIQEPPVDDARTATARRRAS